MTMEALIRSIEEAGKRETESIKKETDASVKEITKGFEAEAEIQAKKMLDSAKSEARLAKERIISKAKIEARQIFDSRKNDMIDKSFEEAKKKILSMNESEKKKILEKLAKDGSKDMLSPEIFADRKYAKLISGAKEADIDDFGVIIKSKDGKVSVTNTLTERMEEIKSTMRHEVAKVLFE